MSAAISFSWGSSLSLVVHFIRAPIFPRLPPPSGKKKRKKRIFSWWGPFGGPTRPTTKKPKKKKRGGEEDKGRCRTLLPSKHELREFDTAKACKHYCAGFLSLGSWPQKKMRKDWKEVTCLLSVLPDTKTWCLTPFSLVDYLLTYVALHTRCQLRCRNLAFRPSCWGVVKITPVRFAHWKLYEGLPFGLSLERLIGNS